jgi:hypothetical protein
MIKTRYTISTKGSCTTVLRKPGSPKWPRATGTACPPFEEIKHLFPSAGPKRSRKKRKKR